MEDIVFEGYDEENERLVFITSEGKVIHVKDWDDTSVPDPTPTSDPLVLTAYMVDGEAWTDVSDRFEVLKGDVEDGALSFHIRTLADKMSAQEGTLYVNVKGLSSAPNITLTGTGSLLSPRKPDFPQKEFVVSWASGDGEYAIWFSVDGNQMAGSATTSVDVPHNWHYGFDMQGSIPIV